jgi:class 3 adenylate cyclase
LYNERRVRLGGRPLDVLCVLASAGGRLVTKDELLKRLWPGRAVEEGNLHVHISALRRALGDNGDGHSFIVTVPGRGYRLAGLGGSELAGTGEPEGQAVESSDNSDKVADEARADPDTGPALPADVQVLERRQLTIVSCELAGADRLAAQLDPEDLSAAVARFSRCCSDVVAAFGGSATGIAGGIMLCYFGYPRAREHDAEQAIRAGLALVEAVRTLDVAGGAPQVRVGIATGPVVICDLIEHGRAEGSLIGETVTYAAALRRSAEPGSVVIAESSRRLVGDLFDVEMCESLAPEGSDEPIGAYKVLRQGGVDSRFQALRGPRLTPIVGRDEEIDLLLRRWERAKSGEPRVVLVTGEPGIGKSRLCAELREHIRQGPHTCVLYFCSPHHQDSAFYPIVRQLEVAAGFADGDGREVKMARLRALLAAETSATDEDVNILANMLSLGVGSPAGLSARHRRDLTFKTLIGQLDALTRRCPVLISFEDAHWSDPSTLELLDLVVRSKVARPVLILITFRPGFTAPWTGLSHVTTLTLNRLDRNDSATLARRVLGEQTLPG